MEPKQWKSDVESSMREREKENDENMEHSYI